MKIPAKHHKFYVASINKLAKHGQFEWRDLVNTVNGTDFEPKNWLVVRAVLQQVVKSGKLVRDADLSVERYIAV